MTEKGPAFAGPWGLFCFRNLFFAFHVHEQAPVRCFKIQGAIIDELSHLAEPAGKFGVCVGPDFVLPVLDFGGDSEQLGFEFILGIPRYIIIAGKKLHNFEACLGQCLVAFGCVHVFFICHFSPHGFNVDFVIVLDYDYNILIQSENIKGFLDFLGKIKFTKKRFPMTKKRQGDFSPGPA